MGEVGPGLLWCRGPGVGEVAVALREARVRGCCGARAFPVDPARPALPSPPEVLRDSSLKVKAP